MGDDLTRQLCYISFFFDSQNYFPYSKCWKIVYYYYWFVTEGRVRSEVALETEATMATTARFAATSTAASAASTTGGGGGGVSGGGGGGGVSGGGSNNGGGNTSPPTPTPATSPPAQAQTTQLIVLPASLHQVLVNLTCITTLLSIYIDVFYSLISFLFRAPFRPNPNLFWFFLQSIFLFLFSFIPSSQVQVVRW